MIIIITRFLKKKEIRRHQSCNIHNIYQQRQNAYVWSIFNSRVSMSDKWPYASCNSDSSLMTELFI